MNESKKGFDVHYDYSELVKQSKSNRKGERLHARRKRRILNRLEKEKGE